MKARFYLTILRYFINVAVIFSFFLPIFILRFYLRRIKYALTRVRSQNSALIRIFQ